MSPKTSVISAVAVLITLGGAHSAEAQAQNPSRFGNKGQLAVTGEDLVGYSSQTIAWSDPNPNGMNDSVDFHDTSNHLMVFGNSGTPLNGPLDTAGPVAGLGSRIGGHYFLAQGVSLGGSLGYESFAGSFTGTPPGGNNQMLQSVDKGTGTIFTLMPKVGYALMLSNLAGFWFRGGVGWVHGSFHGSATSDVPNSTWNFWLVDLEGLFVLSPVPHIAFYAGPVVDFSFIGTQHYIAQPQNMPTTVDTEHNMSYHRFGLGMGFIGYFDL